MLSKKKIKEITSFQLSKFRKQHQTFVVEGEKIVGELLASDYEIIEIFGLSDWIEDHAPLYKSKNINVYTVSLQELERISSFKTPNKVLATVKIPENFLLNKKDFNDLILILDEIQDPGNLGTIIRTADWFGVKHIVCSQNTVSIYNPKALQSTMGSFLRVKVCYTDLLDFLKNTTPATINIFGASLKGRNLYEEALPKKSLLVIGNESKGISKAINELITHHIFIPSFRKNTAESLNAAVATGIFLNEFRRR